ncbi:unnamed protein product, partial [Ectocarpus sp. 12 AP-2014]
DHGEHNGAHELIQKSTSYEESVRVPFIVRLPEHVKNPKGWVTQSMVNTGLDLMPTLLDFAGAPVPSGLDGLSVKPIVEHSQASERGVLIMESQMDKTDIQLRMVRTERFKYTLYDRGDYREMLFDLDEDPGELVNLAVETRYGDVLNAHRKHLYDWCRSTGDTFAKHYSHAPHPIVPSIGYA